MTFQSLYRISMYVMLFLATLSVSLDASSDNPLAVLYPPAVAVIGVLAFLTVDRRPGLGLTRELANMLAFVSIGLAVFEYWQDESLMVMAFAHFFVYLQLIKMLLPKTIEDDWYLVGLGLIQVLIGAFLARGDQIGLVLVAWAITTLWTMGLFYLRRRADWQVASQDRARSIIPAIDPLDPYPSLVNLPFLASTAKMAATTLVLGGLIFLVLPRWSTAQGGPRNLGNARHLTGFSDEVKLGQIGEILENESVVLSAEFYDQEDRRIAPDAEQLWRGVAMTTYHDGRWLRSEPHDIDVPWPLHTPRDWPTRRVKQHIKLEPNDSSVLFAIRPILAGNGRYLRMNQWDGMVYRTRYNPTASYEYDIISANDGSLIQPGEAAPTPSELNEELVEVPEPLKTRLWPIVEPLVKDIPRDRVQERAERLMAYLRDSGEFSYTLRMRVVDRSLDPVEDFLINRKSGHCEYFASALTLMLRSIGIPARMVNGFKGGDWNELGRVMTVRQKHAHSWVEVYLDGGPMGHPLWLTMDPTPSLEREESVARVGGFASRLLPVSDFIRYIWVFYIAGFNADRQERTIYGPLRMLWSDARTGFAIMWDAVKSGARWLLHFRTANEFFSIRGFLVSVIALLTLSGLGWLGMKILARLRNRFGKSSRQHFDPTGMLAYRRLMEILADDGLDRPPAETPREFAQRASEALRHRGDSIAGVADVPPQVIDVFYRLRFGNIPPAEETLAFLTARLDALESSLRPAKGGPFGSNTAEA